MSENCRENEKIPFSPNTDSLDIRNKMMKSFGIVSPFLKEDVPSEEEKRRFSSAVHLFSKDVKGNVNYLKDHMLTPRDFRDILVFAGPKSKWKMIPDRSLEELEKHWLEFFVTPDLLHNPSNILRSIVNSHFVLIFRTCEIVCNFLNMYLDRYFHNKILV